jgi:hypothetical protein
VDRPDLRDRVRRRRPRHAVEADPDNAEVFATNHDAFVAKAQALSDALEADQASLPPGRKQLLTYHDAYAYFAKTYGWEVVGAVQPSELRGPAAARGRPHHRPDPRARGPVIFGSEVFPSACSSRSPRRPARATRTRCATTTCRRARRPEHSWLGLMRYDYVTMIEGLGGTTEALEALDVSDVATDSADYPQ